MRDSRSTNGDKHGDKDNIRGVTLEKNARQAAPRPAAICMGRKKPTDCQPRSPCKQCYILQAWFVHSRLKFYRLRGSGVNVGLDRSPDVEAVISISYPYPARKQASRW